MDSKVFANDNMMDSFILKVTNYLREDIASF